MTDSLNVALVGYGFAGAVFHAPLIRAVDGLTLHSVVSQRADVVQRALPDVRVLPTLTAACADPAIDLVVIATPNALHAPQALEALAAGKHVVVDKPFTVTSSEARAVIAAAEAAGRVLAVFHNRRWDADFRTLQQCVQAGALGTVLQFESHFDRFRLEVRDRWREREAPGAGLWYDLGPHLVDQALVLFGQPVAVRADLQPQRDGAVVDDWFHVTLCYDRLRVLLHASTVAADHRLRFAVHGTGGSLVMEGMDPQEEALKAGRSPREPGWGVAPRPLRFTPAPGTAGRPGLPAALPGAYPAFYAGVREAVLGRAPNPVPGTQALAVMEVIEAGVRSAAAAAEVRLP